VQNTTSYGGVFGQHASNSATNNSFLFALGGTTTTLSLNNAFAVGYDGNRSLAVVHSTTMITGAAGNTNPFSITTATGNTWTFDTTTGLFTGPSDIRLKHSVSPLDSSALVKILSLNPVTYKYNWQKDVDPLVPGFIAQEFETVFPDMVKTDPETGYKSLSYVSLIPYTVKAIQEMDVRMVSVIPDNLDNTAAARVKEFLRNIAMNGEAIVDTVRTHNLCVDDVCVTRDQFKQMVEQSGVQQQTVVPIIESTVAETPQIVQEEAATPAPVETLQN
jgi:hypothetical protein